MSTQEHGHRTGAISLHRLDGFSDAVFAFAVTLLVVSLEVPHSAHDLLHLLRGTLAFGICFALLISVWAEQARFFKRYPMTDAVTITLNMVLLFTVLTYVYPMKFLFSTIIDQAFFRDHVGAFGNAQEGQAIMVIFGLAVFAVNGVFMLMHRRAWKHREMLKLGHDSLRELLRSTLGNAFTCLIALASITVALVMSDSGVVSGPMYMLIGFGHWLAASLAFRRYPVIQA